MWGTAAMLGLSLLQEATAKKQQKNVDKKFRRQEVSATVSQHSQLLGDALQHSDMKFKVKEK